MQFQFHNIILFDGVCNLCNSSVQFVIRHDKEATFKFASLQSEFGQKILREEQLPIDDLRSFILIENGKVYTRSTAALRVARKLNDMWPLLYGLIIIPRCIRNGAYDLIAKNRYKWFGKQEACWVPTPELKSRFVLSAGENR